MPAWLKIAAVYAAIEAALWTQAATRQFFSWLALALIVVFLLLERRPPRALGIATAGPLAAWWIAAAAVPAAAVIVGAGWKWGTLHPLFGLASIPRHVAGYGIWVLVQQFVAQGFFYRHFADWLGARRAIAATALLFASAHWPNPVLVPVTLAGGLVLSGWFRRFPTIYPLAVAQVLIALSLAVAIPDRVHHHLRVGIGYVHYH